ncbi:mercuric reductase [Silvibacterium acidisoli]|uniref:mercuric reductase n=1 Tax=Acidobacteriaceae bacterium ZG23-2 TaxID=2883246 RepID=UPI00406CBB6B
MTEKYDAIIVGSGQGGNPLAMALARSGKRTAIVEVKHVGGTCVNEGCTPTKTMVASGRVAYLDRRSADYGVHSGEVFVNMSEVRNRKRGVVDEFRTGSEKSLEKTEHLELIRGRASFIAPKELTIALNEGGSKTITADTIVLNVGLRNAVPKVDGLRDLVDTKSPLILNNESIMELDQLPEHLVVLGGGYIGIEFGQMFRRFGSRVTIINDGPKLLGREDADIVEEVKQILVEDGIELLLGTKLSSVEAAGSVLRINAGGKTIEASHLLLAAGRVPNSDSLNCEKSGVACDERGYIKVNDQLETLVPGIYAIGDVKGGPAFTHISYDDYRVLKTNLTGDGGASIRGRMVPYTVFMDPQLGRIGITETEAREQGKKIRVAKMPMKSVARAIETGETRGVMKIVVDAESEQILGAAILGIEGGEVASMIQIAMMGGLKYTALQNGIFSHPTLSEALNNVFSHWVEE